TTAGNDSDTVWTDGEPASAATTPGQPAICQPAAKFIISTGWPGRWTAGRSATAAIPAGHADAGTCPEHKSIHNAEPIRSADDATAEQPIQQRVWAVWYAYDTALNVKDVAVNRQAFHNYEIIEKFEAGLVLTGTEIKSARDGKVNLKDSYGIVKAGEVWLL